MQDFIMNISFKSYVILTLPYRLGLKKDIYIDISKKGLEKNGSFIVVK